MQYTYAHHGLVSWYSAARLESDEILFELRAIHVLKPGDYAQLFTDQINRMRPQISRASIDVAEQLQDLQRLQLSSSVSVDQRTSRTGIRSRKTGKCVMYYAM